jgi:hypothetical protein
LRLGRPYRRSHHELLSSTFGAALDDRDRADLERIIGRISAAIPAD